MNKKRLIKAAIVILLLSITIPLRSEDVELGSFKLPRDINYQGRVIAKGSYNLDLELKEAEAFLLIKKDGEVLCREMAIVIPGKKEYETPRITVTILTRDDDPLLRIRTFVGSSTYSGYYQYIQ